jgi:putative endonuclease
VITPRRQFGDRGEDAATEYLQQQGYHIRARNFLVPQGEIDIIAEKQGEIVFVEVKTRRSSAFGSPFEAISSSKSRRLVAACYLYLKRENLMDAAFRIDAISVVYPGPVIEHLEGVVGE